MIQSAHFIEGQQGFRMVGDSGEAEFHKVTVRGRVEADSGYFRGEIQMQMPMFGSLSLAPVIGGIRNYVNAERRTGTNYGYIMSPSITSVVRVGTGLFRIHTQGDRGLIGSRVGYAVTDILVDAIRREQWEVGQLTVEYGVTDSGLGARHAELVRFINSSGILVDPRRFYVVWLC
jgi:hypothetical protein